MRSRLGVPVSALLAACGGPSGHEARPDGGGADGGGASDGGADGGGASDGGAAGPDAPPGPPGPPALCEVALDCDGNAIPNEPKITCAMQVLDGAGASIYDGPVGIERRGRSSNSFPKAQYAVELRTPAGDEAPTALLGMGRESDWILNGMHIDRALFRNKLVFDMFQSLGGVERFAPQSAYCELTIDGDWRGIYTLGERIKRDDDRVAIAEDGGVGASFILKQDDRDGFRPIGVAHGEWQIVYPRQDDATSAQRAGIGDWLDDLEAAVDGTLPGVDLFDLVDMGSAIDFVLFEELLKNVDAFYLSMHVWKDVGGKLHFAPWDVDLSFGQPLYGTGNVATGWITTRPPLIDALAADPVFQARLVERWTELRGSLLTAESIAARIAFYLETIGPQVEANFDRWPLEDIEFGVSWTGSNQLYPVESHAEELALVAAFIDARLAWIDAHIADYADGNP